MARIGKVPFKTTATGTDSTALAKGETLTYSGERLGVIFDSDAEQITPEQAGHLIGQLCAQVPGLTPRRVLETGLDQGWIATRVYIGEVNAFLREEGRTPTEDEVNEIAVGRFTASGRRGAKGPRMPTAMSIIAAVKTLAREDARFQRLLQTLDSTPCSKLDSVLEQVRAAFAAAGITSEKIKELAAAATSEED